MNSLTEFRWIPQETQGWTRSAQNQSVTLRSSGGSLRTCLADGRRPVDWVNLRVRVEGRGLVQLFHGHNRLFQMLITNRTLDHFLDVTTLDQSMPQQIELHLAPSTTADFLVPHMLCGGREGATLIHDLVGRHPERMDATQAVR